MADVLFILITVAFVLVCVGYVSWCDRIIGPDENGQVAPAEPAREEVGV